MAEEKANRADVCISIASFGDGGAERMMVNLARGLSEKKLIVDFLISHSKGPFLATLPQAVRIVELGTAHPRQIHQPLVAYFRERPPKVYIAAKSSGQEALRIPRDLRRDTQLVVRVGTTVSQRVAGRNPIKRFKSFYELRTYCPKVDMVIAVSQGVAADVSQITGIDQNQIRVLPNPVITPELFGLAQKPVDHPWFHDKKAPVILGAGGFRRQKNFTLLVRAFTLVRQNRPARLVILGEGRQRRRLNQLAEALNVNEDVSLPGFSDNPYAYMRNADVFVLSSLWEGSPNVLKEALAVGTPVVSTDCRSGPSEILKDGLFGALVPTDDPEAMARAIIDTLDSPIDAQTLQSAVRQYTIESSATEYCKAFGYSD